MIRRHIYLSMSLFLATMGCGKYTAETQEQAMAGAATAHAYTPAEALLQLESSLSANLDATVASTLSNDEPDACSDGAAWDTQTDALMTSDQPIWAGRTIYCRWQAESTYLWSRGILCQATAQNSLTFSEDPQEFTANIDVDATDDCFPAAFATSHTGQHFTVKITSQVLRADALGWTQEVRLESVEQPSIDETLKMVLEGEWIAASSSKGWGFSLDFSNQTFRYAKLDSTTDENLQLLLIGADHIEGIYSGHYQLASIMGWTSTGYKTHAYEASPADPAARYVDANLTWASLYDMGAQCLGGSCRRVEGLVFDVEDDFEFMLQPGTLGVEGLNAFAPLSFATVDFLNLE